LLGDELASVAVLAPTQWRSRRATALVRPPEFAARASPDVSACELCS